MPLESTAGPLTLESGPVEWPAVVVHGGAGAYEAVAGDRALAARLEAAVDHAVDAAWEVLVSGGDPVDAVVAAVRVLEEDGGFNAGRGAVPNTAGRVEMDGSVMDGTGRAGAVACVTRHSAVAAARALWAAGPGLSPAERVLLLAGDGADAFAGAAGVATLVPPAAAPAASAGGTDPRSLAPPASPRGTVGAVAVDGRGRLAAATSTGGRSGQPPGRVGDTPIPGAGVWADGRCAVSATGAGEAFVLAGFSRLVSWRLALGVSLGDAVTGALREVERYGGDGGGIALAADRTWAAVHDTRAMARGLRHAGGRGSFVV